MELPVRERSPQTGAGLVVVLTGEVLSVPGLPAESGGRDISLAEDGTVRGLC